MTPFPFFSPGTSFVPVNPKTCPHNSVRILHRLPQFDAPYEFVRCDSCQLIARRYLQFNHFGGVKYSYGMLHVVCYTCKKFLLRVDDKIEPTEKAGLILGSWNNHLWELGKRLW